MTLDPIWRQAEIAWGSFLSTNGHAVTHLNEATGNTPNTNAPMVTVNGIPYRAPDFHSTYAGKSEYWEVKYRSQMDVDPLTGENEFWVSHEVFRDYAELAIVSQTKVWIVVYCNNYHSNSGQWLKISSNTIKVNGRRKTKLGKDGSLVEAWAWPVNVMELISGPELELKLGDQPGPGPEDKPRIKSPSGSDINLHRLELEQLCDALELGHVPQYSVLAICPSAEKLSSLTELPKYGIRLFVVGPSAADYLSGQANLEKFVDSRMIEFGSNESAVPEKILVDGLGLNLLDASELKVLTQADKSLGSRFNLLQFQIVHATADSDLLVTAGAGTGKTETMSERIMFLLSTYRSSMLQTDGTSNPDFLSLQEISLITFTREAAKEMRRRIGRVMVLRQRLCETPVHPYNAWLMQLTLMDVSTIHSFAKDILKSFGALVGIKPDFKVSKGTMDFRKDFHEAISPLIGQAYSKNPQLPALHEFQSFIERLWQKLENHGYDLIDLVGDLDNSKNLVWMSLPESLSPEQKLVAELIAETMKELSTVQRVTAKKRQTLTTNQLVPTALQAIRKVDSRSRKRFKYVFVDEFQDTDAAQIDILIELKTTFESTFFVVGDKKQGIYKFRGAQGDALETLNRKLLAHGFPGVQSYSLVKNFRSGAKLLKQIHPIFQFLNKAKLLDYKESDFLRPGIHAENDDSGMFSVYFSDEEDRKLRCLEQVKEFKKLNPNGTIAILTRYNKQAEEMQRHLRKNKQPCLLAVGGGFFQSTAVKELHTFMSAVLDPSDQALTAQVLETRWAPGLCASFPMQDQFLVSPIWLAPSGGFDPWRTRLARYSKGLDIASDLKFLQMRILDLSKAASNMSLLDWLVKCLETFKPESTDLGEEDDIATRGQYSKNIEHLLTQFDETFVNSPISLRSARDWLGLQIATDSSVDEPMIMQEDLSDVPVAITVHKSKGLEFDCVLIPFPEKPIRTNSDLPNVQTVAKNAKGSEQVLWKWRVDSSVYTNVSNMDETLWSEDDYEILKEDSRLLYVALTRAARKLVIFEKQGSRVPLKSWLYFIDSGRN